MALAADGAGSAVVLMAAAVLALIVSNSPLASAYFRLLATDVAGASILHWINDGLMALFFLLVGLEVKREFVVGHLSGRGERWLPGAAAFAGMAVPAMLFVAVNAAAPVNLRGWAIPAATDIAFALGILALMGSRVPASLKVLLTAIAVIDDLLAILVIALFYTDAIAIWPLLLAVAGVALLMLFNAAGVRRLPAYLLVGIGIWYGVYLSGIHATLAGVAVAMTIPALPSRDASPAPLERLEHALQPWSAWGILPLFGFANAGVSLSGLSAEAVLAPLPVGIALALFLGKQAGISGAIRLIVRLRLAAPPAGASWRQIHAMAVLCGIGFTMSLFIGGLAFGGDPARMDAVKLGVFAGSILSGIGGWWAMRRAGP